MSDMVSAAPRGAQPQCTILLNKPGFDAAVQVIAKTRQEISRLAWEQMRTVKSGPGEPEKHKIDLLRQSSFLMKRYHVTSDARRELFKTLGYQDALFRTPEGWLSGHIDRIEVDDRKRAPYDTPAYRQQEDMQKLEDIVMWPGKVILYGGVDGTYLMEELQGVLDPRCTYEPSQVTFTPMVNYPEGKPRAMLPDSFHA